MCGSALLAILCIISLASHEVRRCVRVLFCYLTWYFVGLVTMVPILVQPVGIPTAIAADFLTTTPVGHSVTAKIVLSSSIVRALRDGCGCKQFINTFGDPVANVMGDVTGYRRPTKLRVLIYVLISSKTILPKRRTCACRQMSPCVVAL